MAELSCAFADRLFTEAIDAELDRRRLEPGSVMRYLGWAGMTLMSHEFDSIDELLAAVAPVDHRHRYPPTTLGARASLIDLAVKLQGVLRFQKLPLSLLPNDQIDPRKPRTLHVESARYALLASDNSITLWHNVVAPHQHIADSTALHRGVTIQAVGLPGGVRVETLALRVVSFEPTGEDQRPDIIGVVEPALASLVRAHDYAQRLYSRITQSS